jgi:uncharacterized membrane protein YdjX (TVP38/TMEM64 family)
MRLFLVIVVIVAIVTAPLLFYGDEIDAMFAGEKGVAFLQRYGAWAGFLAIALIICDLVLPVPTPAVMAALGMLYGPVVGGCLASLGSLLAGMVAYWGCRLLGKRAATFMVGAENLARLGRFFGRVGLPAIAFSRWMPLLPEALACLAGLARMPAGRFTLALAIGSVAMGFVFAAFGSAYSDRPVLGIVLSAMVPLVAWPIVQLWVRRKSRTVVVPVD